MEINNASQLVRSSNYRLKSFTDETIAGVEARVNDWLTKHTNIDSIHNTNLVVDDGIFVYTILYNKKG